MQYIQGQISAQKPQRWKKEVKRKGGYKLYSQKIVSIYIPSIYSQPSVTTCHCSNTCIRNWNSHYVHLLGVLHSTESHSGQGKDLRVGKLTHPESTTHTQCYSYHLLVLHNTCHCLPIHHQICTPLSHWLISPELFHAANVLVTTHFSAWRTWGRVLWAADAKWPLSLLTV